MPNPIPLLLSPFLLLLLPGYLILRVSRGGASPAARPSRRGWLQAAVAGIAASSWAGLLLLECGVYSLLNLMLAQAALSLSLLLLFRPALKGGAAAPPGGRREACPPQAWAPPAFILAAFAAACLWAGPSEYVFGGWDSGEYVNMGASFAEKGSIVYRDGFFASIPPGERGLFTEGGRRYMGFNLTSLEDAVVSPKFMHLYPLWLAVATALAGLRAALSLNIIFTLASIALCWRAALALRGRGAAFAAAGLMAANGLEAWFARAQCAEPLAQLFFLGAALFWILWQQGRGRGYAPLSAACLGMMFLTKFDAILLLPCAAAALLFSDKREGEGAFLLVLFASLLHLSAHMAFWNRPYAAAIAANLPAPLRGGGAILILSAALPLSLAAVPLARRAGIRACGPARLPFAARFAAAAAALSAAMCLYAGGGNLALFGAVFGAGTLWWGMAALAGEWCGGVRREAALPWCAAVAALALYSVSLVGERGIYPWSARRFLPAAVPSLCLFAGCFAAEAASLSTRPWCAFLAAGLGLAAISPLVNFPYLLTARDYAGAAAFLPRLAAATEGYDILIVDQTKLALPLDLLCRRRVLLFKDTGQTVEKCASVEALIGRWLARGKRVAYVTAGPPVYGATISFAMKSSSSLATSVLPLGRAAMPRGPVRAAVTAKILEASPTAEEQPRREVRYELGYSSFGLAGGFSAPRPAGRRESAGRWTRGNAALILPWAGGGAGGEIAVTAAAPEASRVEILVGGRPVGAFDASGPARDYVVPFPPGLLPGERRARIELRPGRGVFLERVEIRTDI